MFLMFVEYILTGKAVVGSKSRFWNLLKYISCWGGETLSVDHKWVEFKNWQKPGIFTPLPPIQLALNSCKLLDEHGTTWCKLGL